MSRDNATPGFAVVGREADGTLIYEDEDGYRYTDGLTLEEFGESNLTFQERINLELEATYG